MSALDPLPGHVLLAADVGGTHARLAIVTLGAGEPPAVAVGAYDEYRCADFPGLGELIRTFLQAHGPAPETCALACSGQRIGAQLVNPTLPWSVDLDAVQREAGLREVRCLNDFEALGYAIDAMRNGRLLFGPATPAAGNALVIGPGTGLGVVFCVRDGDRPPVVVASEAGQMAFAPGSARERDVLAFLARDHAYVRCEEIVSGPGIHAVYAALCALDGRRATLASPEAVSGAALQGGDRIATEAVEIFCAALGGVAADLAMAFGCTGGVYLAGGILPKILPLLEGSRFEERFLDKGVMRPFLAAIPVRLVEHGRLGIIGAARWYALRAGGRAAV